MVLSILGFEICLISFYRSHPRILKVNEIITRPKGLLYLVKKIYNKIQNNFLRADVFGQAQDEHFRQEQGM